MIKLYIYDIDNDALENLEIENIVLSNYIEPTFYDKLDFHEYHKKFVDEVFILGIKSNKKIIGYCYFGSRENLLKAPYSSPFSLIYLKENFNFKDASLFIKGTKKFACEKNYNEIHLTFPPDIYSPELVNVLNSSLFSEGFKISSIEVNNYFDLTNYIDLKAHLKYSPRKVRKNYKRSLENKLIFEELKKTDFKTAYDVIKTNREQMGYPLKILFNQMEDLINMDSSLIRSFVVKKNGKAVAAAIIFDVTNEISQVVYWGDIVEYRNERPMDLLTVQIFDTYKKLEKKHLDIGTSSEEGVINLGLADFKKSIGCNSSIKMVFKYIVKEQIIN